MRKGQIYELTDDYCVEADITTSVVFEMNEELHYILSPADGQPPGEVFYQLRRKALTTHWIEEFEPTADGFYRCLVRGTDGSTTWLRYTRDAVAHNMRVVREVMHGCPND